MTAIRLVLSIVASEDVHLEQLDVKTAFLHGDLDEDIDMIQREEPRRDVHQVGDEREVEVLRSFNWPPSELIMQDGLLPEREVIPSLMIKVRAVALFKGRFSQFNDVSSGYLVAQPQVNPDSTIAQVEHITPFTYCGTGVQRLYNMLHHVSLEGRHIVVLGAIYRTEVCTEVCAGAIYPNKVVSEPGYDKQWQKTISREYTNYLLSAEDRYRGRGYDRGQEAEQKQVKIIEDRRDKVQAEYYVLELQPEGPLSESIFEACSLQGLTLKDVRYILGLKRRLISVRQLDEEGYHVGVEDQHWKDTKGSLVVARGNKRGSLYMVEIGMKMLAFKGNVQDVQKLDIYFCKPGGLGKLKKLSFIIS
ncbi:retrovirus-related pol polyprotein from transposon TNT 1-94 [Tanacetum coccineum]